MAFCGECKHFRSGEDYPRSVCASYDINRRESDTPLLKSCFERKLEEEILKVSPEFHGLGINLKLLWKRLFKK